MRDQKQMGHDFLEAIDSYATKGLLLAPGDDDWYLWDIMDYGDNLSFLDLDSLLPTDETRRLAAIKALQADFAAEFSEAARGFDAYRHVSKRNVLRAMAEARVGLTRGVSLLSAEAARI